MRGTPLGSLCWLDARVCGASRTLAAGNNKTKEVTITTVASVRNSKFEMTGPKIEDQSLAHVFRRAWSPGYRAALITAVDVSAKAPKSKLGKHEQRLRLCAANGALLLHGDARVVRPEMR